MKCGPCSLAFWLIIIGALNWGLVGLGSFLGMNLNVVYMLLGRWPILESIVYILVGLAALFKLFAHCKCGTKPMGA